MVPRAEFKRWMNIKKGGNFLATFTRSDIDSCATNHQHYSQLAMVVEDPTHPARLRALYSTARVREKEEDIYVQTTLLFLWDGYR